MARAIPMGMIRTAAIVLAIVSLTACGDDPPRATAISHDDAERILESTPWFDRAPETETDVINAYIFGGGEGLYFTGNSYKGSYELFRYFLEDDGVIKFRFLDEGKKYSASYSIERAHRDVFDYKLTLHDSPRGPQVYYGFDAGRSVPPLMRKIAALKHAP